MQNKLTNEFERHYAHLEFIRDLCLPLSATTFKGFRPEIALACIKEMNRMKGFHAETKIQHTIHADEDIQKGNTVLANLIEEHKKEY